MSDEFDEAMDVDDSVLSPSIDLGPLKTYPGYLLRRAQMKVYAGLYPLLAPYGMRPTQFGVLLLIKYNPGVKPSEVAATLGLQRTNFAPLLMDLRGRGLAESRSGTEDKRTRLLFLTAKGEKLLAKLEEVATGYEHSMAREIDPEQRGWLTHLAGWLGQG